MVAIARAWAGDNNMYMNHITRMFRATIHVIEGVIYEGLPLV